MLQDGTFVELLVGGKPGNLFDPAGQATRAEFALILTRYCQQFYLPG